MLQLGSLGHFDIFSLFPFLARGLPVHCYDWRFVHRPLLFVPVIFSTHGHPRSDAFCFSSLAIVLLTVFFYLISVTLHRRKVAQGHILLIVRTGVSHVCHVFFL